MSHLLGGNRGLCIGRAGQVIGSMLWDILFVCKSPTDFNLFRRGGNCLFPLYLYPSPGKVDGARLSRWADGNGGRTPNLEAALVERFAASTELRFVGEGGGNLHETLGPDDIFAWLYAVLNSVRYRERYEEQLKLDFPRVPLPGSQDLFLKLVKAGNLLVDLHLLEAPKLENPISTYAGPTNPVVGRVGWSNGTVWLDAYKTSARNGHRATDPGTIGFTGVPENVWDFQVGGYQVCHKWLKDRKGRALTVDDINCYQKVVVALHETIRVMEEIDVVIEQCGGWPDAFQNTSGWE